jgi:hypothetical protein
LTRLHIRAKKGQKGFIILKKSENFFAGKKKAGLSRNNRPAKAPVYQAVPS